jgi:hypothetical protein
MSEEKKKVLNLMAYWLFGTVMIVFAAITTYIALWVRPLGASMGKVLMMGLPIWGGTAVLAALIYAGYYFYTTRQP